MTIIQKLGCVCLALGMLCVLVPSTALAQGLTVKDHKIAADVDGDGSPVPATHFSDEDDRAISWVKLDGDLQDQKLRWDFFDPQGHLYASEQQFVFFSGLHWSWITINGSTAAQMPGQWTVKFFIDGELQFQDAFTISPVENPPPPGDGQTPSLTVVKHLIATDVQDDGTPVPGNTFSSDDDRTISWIRLDGNLKSQVLRWEFLDPQGRLFASEQHSVSNFQIHWVWITIKGTAAAKMFGQWSVKFFIDGKLQFTDNFTISSTGVPPPSSAFVICAAGDDGVFDNEEVFSIVEAWDTGQEYRDCGIPTDSDIVQILRLWARGTSLTPSALQSRLGGLVVQSIDTTPIQNGIVTFNVEGQGIDSVAVKIFDLRGRLIAEESAIGNRVTFSTASRWANGVYLYAVTVHGLTGEVTQSRLKKLVVSR